MKKLLFLLPIVLLVGGCTYQNVGLLNDAVISDLEAGIADIDGMLAVERQAAWDAKVAVCSAGYKNDLARIGASDLSWSKKLVAYENLKAKLAAKLETSAILLDKRMLIRRQNRLQNFINALKTAKGTRDVLAIYVAPNWEAVESLTQKAKLLIFGG